MSKVDTSGFLDLLLENLMFLSNCGSDPTTRAFFRLRPLEVKRIGPQLHHLKTRGTTTLRIRL